ncbi:hypothetical protein ABFB10_13890 [Ponticoccus litoralis]|uniref:Cache domain-containing protein n=1 Tax=Ponticoccus litoralis TaxID=422297 RepID=A0AAW9ST74_9RHOB
MNRVSTFGKRISTRLALLLTLALLPLGLISLYQTQQVIDDAQDVTRASLMSETVAASHAGRELIQQALGAAQGLGAAVVGMPVDSCNAVMQEFVRSHETFSFAGLITPELQTDCNSAATPTDVSQSPTILGAVDAKRPYVDFTIRGTYSGEAVTVAVQPIRRGEELVGMISISIPHRIISALIAEASSVETVRIATINSNGDIVVANNTVKEAQGFLPRDITNQGLSELRDETFEAVSNDGERRLYAVSSVLPQSVVMVGSWPVEDGETVIGGLQSGLALVFPIVMWIAGIAVAYVGLQRLVIRHVSGLRSAMRRFALGDRTVAALTLGRPARGTGRGGARLQPYGADHLRGRDPPAEGPSGQGGAAERGAPQGEEQSSADRLHHEHGNAQRRDPRGAAHAARASAPGARARHAAPHALCLARHDHGRRRRAGARGCRGRGAGVAAAGCVAVRGRDPDSTSTPIRRCPCRCCPPRR